MVSHSGAGGKVAIALLWGGLPAPLASTTFGQIDRRLPMDEDEPNIINSHLSRIIVWNGYRLRLEIYRLDDRPGWSLEVVNQVGTSIVWDDLFDSDEAAETTFRETLKTEGLAAFRDEGNVVPMSQSVH